MGTLRASTHVPLYEQLADELAGQIEQGAFRPGERLPSVRQTSRHRDLSMTTVLQAYHTLEDRRLIEARPQSGYYVLPHPRTVGPAPQGTARVPDPTAIDIDELALMIMRDTTDPGLVQFGAAIAAPELLPTEKLGRITATLARNGDVRHRLCGTPEGCIELRAQVAQRSFLTGCSLAPDEIIITGGCTEAISLGLRAVCQPGDLVAIESPTYFGLLQILQAQGLRGLEIPTHPRDGISLDALRFALDHYPVRACLVVTNYSNPLGACMSDDDKHSLVRLLAERAIPLIEDNIQGELYHGGQQPRVAKAYDRDGLVMLCHSFSKDISVSLRVGWMAPGRFRPRVERLKMATNFSTPFLSQIVIAQFIESGGYDQHLRRIRRAYAAKVAAMAEAVLRYFPAGTRVTTPGGGYLLWLQLPDAVDALHLYREALKAGITLAPGCMFASAPERYRNFIRLNAAYMSDETLPAIRTLAGLVARLAGGSQASTVPGALTAAGRANDARPAKGA
jgi:DNA-binding transcriptional MocR family regulator